MENRNVENPYVSENTKEEWINGIRYMSPSPSPNHGRVYSELFYQIFSYLRNKECEVFPDKTDLTLKNVEDTIVIEDLKAELKKPIVPDLFVICNERFEKINNNIVCIPDYVLEVVSPGSVKMDYETKKELYIAVGVKEYWIVDYMYKKVTVCFKGEEKVYGFEDKIKVNIFDDLNIDLSKVKLFEY